MKKIVSVLAVAALSLGSVFAEVTLEYKGAGYIMDYEKTETKGVDNSDTTTTSLFDLAGYDGAKSHFILKAGNDFAGVVVDFDPNAQAKQFTLDEYYAWFNVGNLQVTTGKYTGRYAKRVNTDAGKWANHEFERYKLGVSGFRGYAALGVDVDNLTKIWTIDTDAFDGNASGTNQLASALAYTFRGLAQEDDALMIKASFADTSWGDLNEHNTLRTAPAFEVAYRNQIIDVNALFKSNAKQQIAFAGFLRYIGMENLNALVGFTYGKILKKGSNENGWEDSDYSEMGIDLRLRYAGLMDGALSLTTMHNISILNFEKGTNGDNKLTTMWNMVSGLYRLNEALNLQLTVHNEMALSCTKDGADKKPGLNLEFVPGVIIKASDNASITTGVIIDLNGISADDGQTTGMGIKIPFVLDVAL
ncbi:MAG: hypothetical protein IJP62_06755 [Treponema sp.]|nr:hypothetical protein [Treponema sp.]